MKNAFVALLLALAIAPVAALADEPEAPGAPPALSTQQRQALFQTFRTFHDKEAQLHQQMRSQILSSLSSTHREAIASLIGQLAISSNPNPQIATRQIDALLSQGEQQRIIALHNSFRAQAKALHDQMRQQLRSEMPAGPPHDEHMNRMESNMREREPLDAGSILLRVLSQFEPMEMHGWGHPLPPPAP